MKLIGYSILQTKSRNFYYANLDIARTIKTNGCAISSFNTSTTYSRLHDVSMLRVQSHYF